jgi:hypothetical protein
VGNYIVERPLGAGGQADVFLARDVVLRRSVALKILFATDGPDVRAVEEARLIATLDHPNVVRVFHVQLHQGTWSMAMEYVDGTNLDTHVKRMGALSPSAALKFAIAATDALEHAHQIGVVHRDIKPQNLLISRAGVLKLADFGLASLASAVALSESRLGTPQFMAPEIWAGESATQQSDLYSLGATLLFMLTASPPFSGSTVESLKRSHLSSTPKIPSSVPSSLAEIILRCLAKKPKSRPSSAKVLQQELASCLLRRRAQKSGVDAPPPTADTDTASRFIAAGARVAADSAVMELPPFASAVDRLDKTLKAGAPIILCHGPPDALEKVVRSALELNSGQIYLAARVTLTSNTPGVIGAIAQRLRLDRLGRTTAAERIIGELEPARGAPSPVPGMIQLSFNRSITDEDIADIVELGKSAHGKSAGFLLLCPPESAHRLGQELASPGQEHLLREIEVRGMSTEELRRYVEVWTQIAGAPGVKWTEDAFRLLIHYEAIREAPLDRLLYNAVTLGLLHELPFFTSWTVAGAAAHNRYIHSLEDILPKWRERASAWPDAEMLSVLATLRRVTEHTDTQP